MGWKKNIVGENYSRCMQWLMVLCMVLIGPVASAQGFESVMSPGKLSKPHAKYQDDCAQCHVKFNREGQDKRCLDCHKETRADVSAHTGYHGKMKPQVCKTCHTEHKGVDTKIVVLDKKQFDHLVTDYVLSGKHQTVVCEKCHLTGKRYREAGSDCVGCHTKDDKHKGSLGKVCADCHTSESWKEAKFDHSKTKFELTGKHIDTKCVDCHINNLYKDTPTTCFACHKKNDNDKGHKGLYGQKCESCHATKDWKQPIFSHDKDTKYELTGKHRAVKCASCHKVNPYVVKTSQECFSCHEKDDKHKGSLGKNCSSCHTEKSWKEVARFSHDKTDFPLLGKHIKTECKQCHEGQMFKLASKDCFACHKKDDKHATTLGQKCGDCHTASDWKAPLFKHDKTRFQLRNAHADLKVKCVACHKDVKSYRDTSMLCVSCHKKDDKHEGQSGPRCESCHTDKTWKIERFDHNKTWFALTGRHVLAECKRCHLTTRFKDVRPECFSCHEKEDKHKLAFGVMCQTCHNTRAWPLWSFDHDILTHYRLTGAHMKVTCANCHSKPAPTGKLAAALNTNCQSCHRGSDPHDGKYGPRCEQCHVTESWKLISNHPN